MKVLVVGARHGSLGHFIRDALADQGFKVTTAGFSGQEEIAVDATDVYSVEDMINPGWDHIVCTIGMNLPGTVLDGNSEPNLGRQLAVNVEGPHHILCEFVQYWRGIKSSFPHHFVAISSNSAQIPRSQSGGYCASKAALSMMMRCAAREVAELPFSIYTYEPGWLYGTPMSEEVAGRLELGKPLHSIPGQKLGIMPWTLAQMIASNIANTGKSLNGCTIRVDGGER